jgi:hypothetical protein
VSDVPPIDWSRYADDFDFLDPGLLRTVSGQIRRFGEALVEANAALMEQLVPAPDLLQRVIEVALSQGFLEARAERRVAQASVIELQRRGPHELVEWVAIVRTGRGELAELVEIPGDVLPAAQSWTCPRCGRAIPLDSADCLNCEGSLSDYAWLAAFRALGVAV